MPGLGWPRGADSTSIRRVRATFPLRGMGKAFRSWRRLAMMTAIILCYHKVGSEAKEGRWLNIVPERLASHIRFLRRRGRRFVRAADLAGDWRGDEACLTFDDAYLSALTVGREVLERLGAVATFYAVPSRVGGSSDWDDDRARPLAGWDVLRDAAKTGHEIGNHSFSHARLDELSEDAQRAEIAQAHEALLSRGLIPATFCYPYGAIGAATARLVGGAGYRAGMALGKRPARADDPRLALPRLVMAYSDGLPMLIYKLAIRPRLRRG